ncbi:MAG: zinc-binding dehydrogenase [Abditibacteriota bacterium]|nr:zinc-binding dehydrogenase [Abditibacteriota bacterium]MBP5738610.1 zinc-binding dehydrogenase [Abditibacteriota bacterium]
MADILKRYKDLDYTLPQSYEAWQVTEAGVENFGKNGTVNLPLKSPADNEILVRVDAIGICFSDVKLVTQGSTHARITGRDLVKDPVTPGHEVALTIVEAGAKRADKFKPGERYIIQADVFNKGVSTAFGYVLPGGMQQFCTIGDIILDGDGDYLIPMADETGYAEAALVEPWTCVVAAYRIEPRRNFKPGGTLLYVGCDNGDYCVGEGLCEAGKPAKIILADVPASFGDKIKSCACTKDIEVVEVSGLTADKVQALKEERTGGKGFDDIVILGTPDPDLAEALAAALGKYSVMAFLAKEPMARPLKIDIGRIHYDYIDYIGTNTGVVADAYSKSRVSEFTPGGSAWFVGAAGPMGQMHVQRAAKMKGGPKKIFCTDVSDERLNYLKNCISEEAKANGVEMVFINPMNVSPEEVDKAIKDLTGGKGFDDIVILAPIAPLVEGALPYMAKDCLMNIFAGVLKGTMATIDVTNVYNNGNRFVGSSGSKPQDMVDTLRYTEEKQLPTINSCAAIGGMDAMPEGLMGVKTARFPGKTVIFPQIKLPLTALPDLKNVLPNVYDKLRDGMFWTNEAEKELLRSKLDI